MTMTNIPMYMQNNENIFSHFIKIYMSKLHAIVYIDTDLDLMDLDPV